MLKIIAIAVAIAAWGSAPVWAQEKEPKPKKEKKELKVETFSDTSGTGVRVSAVPKGTRAFERIRINPDKAYRLEQAYAYFEAKNYQFAQYLLEDLLPVYRGKPEGEKIFFHYAYTHFYLKNFTFAAYYFKQFHTTFPNSGYAEEALYMSAEANYQMSPGYRHTQEETMNALEGMQLFVNTYPQSTRVLTANQKMDKLRAKLELKDFEAAKGYLHRKQYRAAMHTLKALMVDYPETKNLEEIRFLLFKAACKFAQNSVSEKQQERYEEAFTHYNLFVKKHPQSKFRADADQLHTQAQAKLAKLHK